LLKRLPMGLRGLTLAALLAAFMSTFDATINAGASYAVRDLYQRYLRPRASDRELVRASYVASALVVIVGVVIGFGAESIAQMFQWIMLALGGGVMVPCILRWYWWRFNGWGFTAGTLSGIVAALAQAQWFPKAPIWEYFPIIVGINLVASVAATLLTEPADRETLKHFYKTVQPGGWWGPIAREVAAEDPAFRKESFARDLVNTLIAVPCVAALYIFPIYLMLRQWATMACWLGVAVGLGVVLYFTWYKHLPAPEKPAGEGARC
ncbi:MAG TPA: sodium:solute symporter, partial [Planctomycetota bacterium]|nr:sodium:solute symporter [Planctomycetota bacterium]